MNKLHTFALAIALAGVFTPTTVTWALDVPKSFKADSRVRHASYNPENVIQLDAVLGVATMIELEPGEEYVYHVYGDSKAYAFTTRNNYLFFKPIAEQADSNLLVLTNRRSYQFKVNYHEESSKALYKLTLRYPDSEAAAAQEYERAQQIDSRLAQTQASVNWQTYTMGGDLGLAPIHAWDDGRQTWLQFPASAELPVVYRVTGDGQETVANFHMAGARTMVLHHTAARWHLRAGSMVLAIHNEGFGTQPIALQTGTISPQVERSVVGATPAAPVLEDRPLEQIPVLANMPAATAAPTSASPVPVDDASVESNHSQAAMPSTATTPVPSASLSAQQTDPGATPKTLATGGEFVGQAGGDQRLMPTKIQIEGEVTLMQFGDFVPGIFILDQNGSDQLVGMDFRPGNLIAVQAVADRWHLRHGGSSLVLVKKEP